MTRRFAHRVALTLALVGVGVVVASIGVLVVDAKRWKVARPLVPTPIGKMITKISVAEGGRRIVFGNDDELFLWEWRPLGGTVTAEPRVPRRPEQLAISRDGRRSLRLENGTLALIAEPAREVIRTYPDFMWGGHGTLISPDGKLAATLWEKSVDVLDLETGRARTLEAEGVGSFAFGADGHHVAVVDRGHVSLHDITSREPPRVFQARSSIMACAISDDGRWVGAVTPAHVSVIVWNAKTGEPVCARFLGAELPKDAPYGDVPLAIAFDPEGHFCVVGTQGGGLIRVPVPYTIDERYK